MAMSQKKKYVALLPMKANSERVRGKNFRPFHGRPLFDWILQTLLKTSRIGQIVINTDARSILKENGLTETDRILIRDRKPELCGDMTSMNLILKDDIENVAADAYVMTHTTNPLLQTETIQSALESYEKNLADGSHDSLFAVNRFQTRFYKKDATPINHNPEKLIRTQDLEPWYEENSNLYVFSRSSFAATQARIGKKPALFEMNKLESVDIDDAESWNLALAIAQSGLVGGET